MATFWGFTALYGVLCVLCVYAKTKSDLDVITQFVPDSCYRKTADGDQLSIHYTGSLETGEVFDSSRGRGEPFTFQLGEGQVIKGWDLGLKDMCVGEKRKLKIPGHLGYGARGSPPKIPPHATLVFETELMGIVEESIDVFLMRLLRFLGLPALGGIIVYYMYNKYQQEAAQNKKERKERGKKKQK